MKHMITPAEMVARPRNCSDGGPGSLCRSIATHPATPYDLAGKENSAVLERLADVLGLRAAYRKDGRGVLTRADGTDIEAWRENYPHGNHSPNSISAVGSPR